MIRGVTDVHSSNRRGNGPFCDSEPPWKQVASVAVATGRRQVLRWIGAQAGMVEPVQVFLPYATTKTPRGEPVAVYQPGRAKPDPPVPEHSDTSWRQPTGDSALDPANLVATAREAILPGTAALSIATPSGTPKTSSA